MKTTTAPWLQQLVDPLRPSPGRNKEVCGDDRTPVYYGDHSAAWLNGERFDYRYTRQDVEANLERRWNLTPR